MIVEQSFADILTAIVIYNRVIIESSSTWNETQLLREGAHAEGGQKFSLSWFAEMKLRKRQSNTPSCRGALML
jgi:hypothetical protein